MSKKIFNLPNFLTLMRVVLIVFLVPCFYYQTDFTRVLAIVIFVTACITDYLDGYFARVWQQTTKFGQLFDPIADKMLVGTALLLMAGFDFFSKTALIPALIILCREMFISGLREFMEAKNTSIPVTRLAKYKTAFQMIAIGLLFLADAFPYKNIFSFWGELFLWFAAILTFITGLEYFQETIEHLHK